MSSSRSQGLAAEGPLGSGGRAGQEAGRVSQAGTPEAGASPLPERSALVTPVPALGNWFSALSLHQNHLPSRCHSVGPGQGLGLVCISNRLSDPGARTPRSAALA